MRESNVAERLKFIMNRDNLRQIDILKNAQIYAKKYNIKIAKNDLSQYISGKVEPGSKKIAILSLVLNVNEAWLMGYDVPIERKNDEISNELMKKINSLNKEQQKAIINIIDNMK